ncbi:MAG: nnr [Burkholderiaceae bacterium]|nr:nnr [Burkholderiaceae bacterium]
MSMSQSTLLSADWIESYLQPRATHSHKGDYGHALLIAGARGTVGASILAARACLRSGVGLLTVHAPECAFIPLQTSTPEAMISSDSDDAMWTDAFDIKKYSAIGVGCGIGQATNTRTALRTLIELNAQSQKPTVIDADALNIMASEPDLLTRLPANTILTPHPKEFERLVTHLNLESLTEDTRVQAQLTLAQTYNLIIVLKGANTCIALPDGHTFINTTGNAGMAKGGSGDALTGIILALLAQGYVAETAACIGVYVHGLAGDIAAQKLGQTAMLPSDLIECLGQAFCLK